MLDFYNTHAGKKYFEKTLPKIADELEKANELKEREILALEKANEFKAIELQDKLKK